MKLAEALLRRKELDGKVKMLSVIKSNMLTETVTSRKQLTDSLDDIICKVSKVTASQVTAEFDFYARQLRLIDAAIQQANWTTEITVDSSVTADYAVTQ